MRKLIQITQDYLIECDNPNCDYFIPNETKDANVDGAEYINVACPKCGENLLTEKDYLMYKKYMSAINWINKWFSWLTFFRMGKNDKTVKIKIHNGINEINEQK